MSHELGWLREWASSSQPHAYGILWLLWVVSGLRDAWRKREAPSAAKAGEAVERLASGLVAMFALHVLQDQDWSSALWIAGVTGGVSIAQVWVVAPVLIGLLQNLAVLPKPGRSTP